MKYWKKLTALGLALVLALSLTACGQDAADDDAAAEDEQQQEEVTEPVEVSVQALKGPTGMGLAFIEDASDDAVTYDLTIAAKADQVGPMLLKGEANLGCVPANVAAVLNNKSNGEIVTLGINTLGVLYVMEKGNSVNSIQDLKGKTITAVGKNMTPEYVLRYLLTENGLDPDTDVVIDWKSEASECVAAMASGAATIAMMPQPFVTVAEGKIEGLRMALDLTAEWNKLDNGSQLLTGVVVGRRDYVEANTEAVDAFLAAYADSVEKVNADPAAAAERIGELGIVEAPIAEKAIPHCNIVFLAGQEMKDAMSGYLQVLFDANPESVGGQLPADDFYYGA